MFKFEYPSHLWALLGLVLLIGVYYWANQKRQQNLSKFATPAILPLLMPKNQKNGSNLAFIALLFALFFLIIAWANPQMGAKKAKSQRKSADIYIALDISNSMLSDDIRPSRIEKAKQFTTNLIESLKTERIGIILFAGNAYLQMPLTADYAAATLFIKSANTEMAPSQGNAIGDAIEIANQSFERDSKRNRALIVITDGETHDSDAIKMAKTAHENGLIIFTIGVGSENGGKIPQYFAGQWDYKRDEKGEIVTTKLNEAMLKDLASAGTGLYARLGNDDNGLIQLVKNGLDKVEKMEYEQYNYDEFESYFQIFLLIGLAFLLFYWWKIRI